MKKLFSLAAAVALLALSSAVWAYPALTGPTGGATQPDAAVIDQQVIGVAVDYLNNGEGDLGNSIIARVQYGVAENTEVGFAYTMQDIDDVQYTAALAEEPPSTSSGSFNAWSLNAKRTMALSDRINGGLGIIYQDWHDLPGSDMKRSFTQIYAVASSVLKEADGTMPAIGASLGVNYTMGELSDGYENYDDSAFRAFLAMSATFQSGLSLIGEFQTKASYFDSKPLSSVVARYPISEKLSAQLGVTNSQMGISGGSTHNFFGGLTMNFGGTGY